MNPVISDFNSISQNFNDVLSYPQKLCYELVNESHNLSKNSEYLLSWIVSTFGARITFIIASVCSVAKIAFNLLFSIIFLLDNIWTWSNRNYDELKHSAKALLHSLKDLGLELTGAIISPSLSNFLNTSPISKTLKIAFDHAKLIVFALGLWTILQPIFTAFKYIAAFI